MFGLPPARTRRVLRFFLVLIPAAAIALAAGYALIPGAPAPNAQAEVRRPALAQDSRATASAPAAAAAAERIESAPTISFGATILAIVIAVPAAYDGSANNRVHDQRPVSARSL